MNKILTLAALAGAALTTTAIAAPASAAIRCGCPAVVRHTVHTVVRHRIAYRPVRIVRPRVEVVYREAPPPPVYDEGPVYEAGPYWHGEAPYGPRPYWGHDWRRRHEHHLHGWR